MADENGPDIGEQRVERLRKKLGTITSSTTRLLNQIDVELSKEDLDVGRVREMLAVLSAKEDSFCELGRAMEEHMALDEVEAEIELSEDYKDRVICMKTRVHRVLRAHETVSNDNPQTARLSDASAIFLSALSTTTHQ